MSDEALLRSLRQQAEALHRAGELWAAVDCYRRALALESEDATLYNHMGGALANLGEAQAAADAFTKAIELDNQFPDPLIHLATLLRAQGQVVKAEPLIGRALTLDSGSYPAWMERGALMMLQNRFAAAAESFERALAIQPADADALHNLGRVAFEAGQEQKAIALYQRALQAKPEQAAVLTNLGLALRATGDFEGARRALDEAVAIEPAQPAAISGLLGLLELEGRYDEALALAERAIAAHDDPLIQLGAARMERRLRRPREALARIEKLATRELGDEAIAMQLAFVRGELHDDLGEYPEAWASFARANAMKRTGFSAADWANRVERIIASYPPDQTRAVAREATERPVFIVGMPRSGTSLAEQILASHPAVYGAGELTTLASLVDTIPARFNGAAAWPEGVSGLSARRLTRLGRGYLRALEERDAVAARVTDKMWQNFEYLGLIGQMLPGARVVHCRRDPLDTGLSCFFQHFIGQVGVPFSYSLEDIGAYYRGYERLMTHWQESCELPVFELEYEQLVSDPEVVIRELVSFVDLPWDAACLAFHQSKRAVNTASVAQVREPIYTRSAGRHRHYESFLAPLREALAR